MPFCGFFYRRQVKFQIVEPVDALSVMNIDIIGEYLIWLSLMNTRKSSTSLKFQILGLIVIILSLSFFFKIKAATGVSPQQHHTYHQVSVYLEFKIDVIFSGKSDIHRNSHFLSLFSHGSKYLRGVSGISWILDF